jgi:pyridoxine/pyridoxamine 5'-phosphate oxidase
MSEHPKGKSTFTFEFVERQLRKRTFGILSTADSRGRPHSTGVLYGISAERFLFFILTAKNYKKVRNIEANPYVSLAVPFPHYYLRFIPDSTVQIQGAAEIVPFEDIEAQKAFSQKRILKMMLERSRRLNIKDKLVFIKIKPHRKIFCYGLGMGIMELRKNLESGEYTVTIPEDRLVL